MESLAPSTPHFCKYCTYSTPRKGDLTKHLRIHTGLKPFPCKDCGNAFTQSSHLKMHRLRRHSKELCPFKCTLCKAAFRTFTHLLRHKKKSHITLRKPGPGKHIPISRSRHRDILDLQFGSALLSIIEDEQIPAVLSLSRDHLCPPEIAPVETFPDDFQFFFA